MAGEVFVDTSAWYPLIVPTHADHARLSAALRAQIRRGQRVVTTNLVVAETHALVLRRVGARAALGFVRTVGGTPNLVVRGTAELEDTAVRDWLERYEDQGFSLTDAVSFAVMADRKIDTALALDRHFGIAGFRVL